jgi:hypothetical protein
MTAESDRRGSRHCEPTAQRPRIRSLSVQCGNDRLCLVTGNQQFESQRHVALGQEQFLAAVGKRTTGGTRKGQRVDGKTGGPKVEGFGLAGARG